VPDDHLYIYVLRYSRILMTIAQMSWYLWSQHNFFLLLQGKCNIDAVNKNKHSSLMLAMSEGRTAIVEYLVSRGIVCIFCLLFLPISALWVCTFSARLLRKL